MATVFLIKILFGITLYSIIVFLMIRVETNNGQNKFFFPKKRKIIPFQEVQKYQRIRDRFWV